MDQNRTGAVLPRYEKDGESIKELPPEPRPHEVGGGSIHEMEALLPDVIEQPKAEADTDAAEKERPRRYNPRGNYNAKPLT